MSAEIKFPEVFPTIETERLSLLPFEYGDVDSFYSLRSNQEFMKYLGVYPFNKKSEARSRIQDIIQDFDTAKGINWKIAMKGEKELIGYVGFWTLDYKNVRAEIGFGMGLEYQGKGYMTEATSAAIDFAFKQMKLHSIKANVDVRNEKSMTLLQKLNFLKEAHFREDFYFDGEFLDSIYYCLIKNDWEKTDSQ